MNVFKKILATASLLCVLAATGSIFANTEVTEEKTDKVVVVENVVETDVAK